MKLYQAARKNKVEDESWRQQQRKNAEKNLVKKLRYSNKNLKFCPYRNAGRNHFDPAGDHPCSAELRWHQPQKP